MSGTGASNLGYGSYFPFSNTNTNYVNSYSTNSAFNFGSNEVPGLPGLAGAKNNVDAVNGIVPGICTHKGGGKKKNIRYKYKRSMRKSKLSRRRRTRSRMRSMRLRALARTMGMRGGKRTRRRTHKKYRGGYSQYQNNLPMSQTYSLGGDLSASNLGLANPPPVNVLSNCTNCVDNYNHYTNKGFPSAGH